jgi:NitT/TauT family transport system permease protein
VPVGILIGLKPERARRAQPFVQFLASFPAPMLFPIFVLLFHQWGLSIEYASIFLMLLGTQWYLLFNIIAGASAVPSDLQEVFRTFNVGKWQLWRQLLLPAVFPAIVTGAVTAAGGAWNASIIAEFVEFHHQEYVAHGVGSLISVAFADGRFALLGASILVLCLAVVLLNRLVWRRLFLVAQQKFSLNS